MRLYCLASSWISSITACACGMLDGRPTTLMFLQTYQDVLSFYLVNVLYSIFFTILKNLIYQTNLPPNITPFICSRLSCAASGISYSTKANPLCFCVTGSHDMLIDLIGPNGRNACLMVSSFSSKEIDPT